MIGVVAQVLRDGGRCAARQGPEGAGLRVPESEVLRMRRTTAMHPFSCPPNSSGSCSPASLLGPLIPLFLLTRKTGDSRSPFLINTPSVLSQGQCEIGGAEEFDVTGIKGPAFGFQCFSRQGNGDPDKKKYKWNSSQVRSRPLYFFNTCALDPHLEASSVGPLV